MSSADALGSGDSTKDAFAGFSVSDVAYKHVNGTPILTSILVPKGLEKGKTYPVMVRWHGGGFVTGSRLYADWFMPWLLGLAKAHSAIAVVPDYRLLPEARAADILDDTKDLFQWLQQPSGTSQFAAALPEGISADVSNILVTGESAGGWLALQSGFLAERGAIAKGSVKAVVSQYPMIDVLSDFYTKDYNKEIPVLSAEQLDKKVVTEYVAGLKGDEVVSSRIPPEGLALVTCMIQRGLYEEYFADRKEREMLPIDALDTVQAFPPVWVFHGTADSAVPVEGTEKFVKKFEQQLPDAKLHVTIRKGEEHGFDGHDAATGAAATLDTDWVKTGVEFIGRYWPHAA